MKRQQVRWGVVAEEQQTEHQDWTAMMAERAPVIATASECEGSLNRMRVDAGFTKKQR